MVVDLVSPVYLTFCKRPQTLYVLRAAVDGCSNDRVYGFYGKQCQEGAEDQD